MTPIADMVADMMARGLPADVIVLAVKTAEQAMALNRNSGGIPVDETAERRRAYDRERKRSQKLSGGIPVETPRNSEPALTLTSSSSEQEDNSIKEVSKKVRARKKPSAEIPPDWKPSEVHFEAAEKLGWPSREAVFDKADDMRIWAGSTGALKRDWDLTFHGFLRRDAPKLRANGSHHAPRPGSKEDTRERTVNALRRLDPHPRADDDRSGESSSAPVSRLLPFSKLA